MRKDGEDFIDWTRTSKIPYLKTIYRITENGKYIVYVKDVSGNITTKEITINNIKFIGPVVASIDVTSPATGNYVWGQKVTVRVTFKNVDGDSVKVKGEAPKLQLAVGSVNAYGTATAGKVDGTKDYIDYTYTVKQGELGIVSVSDYTGGSLTDLDGNKAKITKKSNSGNIVTIISARFRVHFIKLQPQVARMGNIYIGRMRWSICPN